MSCNNPQIIEERIICAKICQEKFNDNPIASFSFENFVLSDDSQYFDTGGFDNREVKWSLYSDEYLIYDFGYGKYYDSVSELSNGSTYSRLILGDLNVDMIGFVESLPNTIVPDDTKFTLYIEVKDNTGISSTNISNKYCFTK